MKKFLKKQGLWVLFAATVIAVALAALSFFSNSSSPFTNLAGILSSPFRSGFTALGTWVNDKQDYYADNRAIKEENAQLKLRIAEMEDIVRRSEADSAENVRLHQLLNLREQRRDLSDIESATIIEHSSSNWTRTLTLNRGTAHGVEKNDCVITESGFLVGIVTELGENWCTVLTLIDSETELGALVFRTDEIGVAQGDFTLMKDGKLKLSYLAADSQPLNGDLIVTSGLGGYYPPDLVIGTVDEVLTS
ncbi:MAG: rod shape-determining protein MreC, partial [Ruthenibacterium sp.]